MGTPTKIHVGAGNINLNPDTTPIDLGYTSEGGTLTYNAELEAITVDQILSPVGYFIPAEECMFETILDEAGVDTMRYSIGHGTKTTDSADTDQKGQDKLEFGGQYILTDYVFEYFAPKRTAANLYVRVRLYKVNISPNLEAAFKKDGKTGWKFTCKAAADTTKDVGKQLGYYLEETADVTGTTAILAVSSTDPADAAAAVDVDDTIIVNFNRSIHPESVSEGNFLMAEADGTPVSGTVAQSGAAQVTFTPDASMTAATVHIFAISENVRALDDYTPMSDNEIINFTTDS
jgi:hypothetical protein